LGLEPELVEGDHGVFEVAVGGKVVFSKQQAGQFIPVPDMVELVKALLRESSDAG
jgi:hypothetical protein